MEYNLAIADMRVNDEVEGFYILARGDVKKTKDGKAYLNAALSDCTGTMPAKMWDFRGSAEDAVGKVVKVRGSVTEFAGALQFTIGMMRPAAAQDTYDLADLVPSAPIDPEDRLAEVRSIVASIEDADYRALCETVLEKHLASFAEIPAAKSVHHAFRSGLLMHTGNMLRLADFLADQYADTVDRSLLLAGTALHDVMKEEEFVFSELGLVTDYSVKGDLLGHLVMGAQEVAEAAKVLGTPEEKSVLLQHMLLSHHGTPERGAAVLPRCAESELLSLIDQIDAHMEVYREAQETTPAGEFSEKIFALEKRIYHHR